MADEYLIDQAYNMLKNNKRYQDDAANYGNVDNTVVGSLLSITTKSPRWATEAAVRQALARIKKEGKRKK